MGAVVHDAIKAPVQHKSPDKYSWHGEIMTLTQLAKRNNIPPTTLRSRLAKGMSVQEAIGGSASMARSR